MVHLSRKSDYSLVAGTADCCLPWKWTSSSCVLGPTLPSPGRPADLTADLTI